VLFLYLNFATNSVKIQGEMNMKKSNEELMRMNLQFFAEGESVEAEGVNETEAAEQSDFEGEEVSNESETEEAAEPQTQTAEANAAFANMRRQLEAAKRQQREVDEMYARQYGNFSNPETGQPIRSAKDYFDAMAAQERVNARAQMQEKGIDPSIIDSMIANSPVIRQSKAATAELNGLRAQQMLENDYKEILELDPSLNSAEEILNDPLMPLMMDKVARGMSLVDAYKIVNFDKLSSQKGQAAKQAAINQVKSKNHLATGAALNVADAGDEIPSNLVEKFKETFPEKSMKELKALYNKTRR
jgi:hypothetical protein